MTKFTSGPWHVDPKRQLRVVAGDDITVASTGTSDRIHDSWAANARLIAAAPDMYEALRLLLETHCCDTGEADYKSEWDGDHTVCADCKPAYAALAKADGKETK